MCRRAINEQIYSEKWKIYYANAIHHHIHIHMHAKFSLLRVARLSISIWKLFPYAARRTTDNQEVNYHARTSLIQTTNRHTHTRAA